MPFLLTAITNSTVELYENAFIYERTHVPHDFIYVMKVEERSVMVIWLNMFPKRWLDNVVVLGGLYKKLKRLKYSKIISDVPNY